jgi:hypothetical protein
MLMYALDSRAATRRDRALAAAKEARSAYRQARLRAKSRA